MADASRGLDVQPALASTVLSTQARTLEDLVKDMMRPMLKAWLDDNLPAMVERLVRPRSSGVSRGRAAETARAAAPTLPTPIAGRRRSIFGRFKPTG